MRGELAMHSASVVDFEDEDDREAGRVVGHGHANARPVGRRVTLFSQGQTDPVSRQRRVRRILVQGVDREAEMPGIERDASIDIRHREDAADPPDRKVGHLSAL